MSTEPITQAELETWKELEAKATPGPCRIIERRDYSEPHIAITVDRGGPLNDGGWDVANLQSGCERTIPDDLDKKCWAVTVANANLLFTLRNNALRLFSAAEECGRLRRAIADLLAIIHDDLTHARQTEHEEAISAAKEAMNATL